MSLDYVYSDEKSQHALRFSDAESTYLTAIQEFLPAAVDQLFDVPDFGEPVIIGSDEIAKAADELIRHIEDRSEWLPSTYQFRSDNWMGTGMPSDWSGGAASFRMPGDDQHAYLLDTRDGKCLLERKRLVDGKMMSREDIGQQTTLLTETCGCIHIRRSSAGSTLRKKLEALRDFASTLPPRQLSKLLC